MRTLEGRTAISDFNKSKFHILFDDHWTTRGLADAISRIDRDALSKEYEELIRCAPSREDRDKSYFVDSHTGCLSGDNPSNRSEEHLSEEHLALALWNLDGYCPRPDGGRTRLLDYQFPPEIEAAEGRGRQGGLGRSNRDGTSCRHRIEG